MTGVEIRVPVASGDLTGALVVPASAGGLVVFAHGSGSSRHSPRNRFVAEQLHDRGLATLLIDLLTPAEEVEDNRTRRLRFDVPLLAARLGVIVDAVLRRVETAHLAVGLFGASTGGGAALVAAAEHPDRVKAVVSRGGRPDLAGDALSRVQAPTLLIVGERDVDVLDLNRRAMQKMAAEVALRIVPGATHLFEEPGALPAVAALAGEWFGRYLPRHARPSAAERSGA